MHTDVYCLNIYPALCFYVSAEVLAVYMYIQPRRNINYCFINILIVFKLERLDSSLFVH